ncbi:MAG: hypothetical protein ACLFVR_08530 [Thiohalospira sp.]
MKQSIKLLTTIFFIAALTLTSCSYRLMDFTVISSKNHNLQIDKSKGIRVEGSSNTFLGFGASIKDATNKALESAGPGYDLLIDGVVMQNDYFFVLGFTVKGTAINSSELIAYLGEEGYVNWYKANDIFNPNNVEVGN